MAASVPETTDPDVIIQLSDCSGKATPRLTQAGNLEQQQVHAAGPSPSSNLSPNRPNRLISPSHQVYKLSPVKSDQSARSSSIELRQHNPNSNLLFPSAPGLSHKPGDSLRPEHEMEAVHAPEQEIVEHNLTRNSRSTLRWRRTSTSPCPERSLPIHQSLTQANALALFEKSHEHIVPSPNPAAQKDTVHGDSQPGSAVLVINPSANLETMFRDGCDDNARVCHKGRSATAVFATTLAHEKANEKAITTAATTSSMNTSPALVQGSEESPKRKDMGERAESLRKRLRTDSNPDNKHRKRYLDCVLISESKVITPPKPRSCTRKANQTAADKHGNAHSQNVNESGPQVEAESTSVRTRKRRVFESFNDTDYSTPATCSDTTECSGTNKTTPSSKRLRSAGVQRLSERTGEMSRDLSTPHLGVDAGGPMLEDSIKIPDTLRRMDHLVPEPGEVAATAACKSTERANMSSEDVREGFPETRSTSNGANGPLTSSPTVRRTEQPLEPRLAAVTETDEFNGSMSLGNSGSSSGNRNPGNEDAGSADVAAQPTLAADVKDTATESGSESQGSQGSNIPAVASIIGGLRKILGDLQRVVLGPQEVRELDDLLFHARREAFAAERRSG